MTDATFRMSNAITFCVGFIKSHVHDATYSLHERHCRSLARCRTLTWPGYSSMLTSRSGHTCMAAPKAKGDAFLHVYVLPRSCGHWSAVASLSLCDTPPRGIPADDAVVSCRHSGCRPPSPSSIPASVPPSSLPPSLPVSLPPSVPPFLRFATFFLHDVCRCPCAGVVCCHLHAACSGWL